MSDLCLLLLARSDDASVRALQQQAPNRVLHAGIADLSRVGWRYSGGCPEKAAACADGRVVEAGKFGAVLCRIAFVAPGDLAIVHPEDREYAAAEMTAFLRAWLAQFPGLRCNEPTWMSLAGPGWHPLQWTWIVSKLGIPVAAAGATQRGCETAMATVAGSQVLGVSDPLLAEYSLRIARAVKARLLSIRFARDGGWRFQSADPRPYLDAAGAAALLCDVGVHAT
jgi:hypothetical protein